MRRHANGPCHFLAAVLLLGLLLVGGCTFDKASVAADRSRFEAVTAPGGPIAEYKVNHPDKAQTWTDFETAWKRSIEAREGVSK